ncbi:MAG TPA: cupin domain-containing protein [Gemmatimonadaceae bacterium]|nr:cupin domain-containing protein [Gemmatimonadaceae bacterium]
MTAVSNDSRRIHFLGNNEITVLVSGAESGGAFSLMELEIQPGGGATALHTDRWVEVFYVLDGDVEWTMDRQGTLTTWHARPGSTIRVPSGVRHRFAGAGTGPSRMLTIGTPEYEEFFRALGAAWEGPYDREKTPQAVGPVFQRFGMRLCTA